MCALWFRQECLQLYLFLLRASRCYLCVSVRCVCLCVKQQYRSNCWCIRGTALWSRGCAGPQYSLCRVVSHHARLITVSASLLAAWQALPSALMLHASDNFISIIRPFAILVFASDRKRALVQLAHNQISPGKSLTPIKKVTPRGKKPNKLTH